LRLAVRHAESAAPDWIGPSSLASCPSSKAFAELSDAGLHVFLAAVPRWFPGRSIKFYRQLSLLFWWAHKDSNLGPAD
jgi:hypothetical protein